MHLGKKKYQSVVVTKKMCGEFMFSKYLIKIFLGLLFLQTIRAQEISDLIEPIKLTAGKSDTLLISDLFYAKSYDLKISGNENINFSFNQSSKKLVLKPEVSFKGFTLLEFSLGKKSYVIPLVLQDQAKKLQSFTFRYKPEKKPANVVVIGSFNNWNREWNPLIEKGNSGIYEAVVNLEPGNYFYKFSIDGKDIIDPENKETVPTGFDGFNSVLRIIEMTAEKRYLHILGKSEDKNGTHLSFYYEQENQQKNISIANIIALLNNEKIKSNALKISGNKIEVSLSQKEFHGEQVFRILISQDGKNSNIQSVFFNDGKTSGTKNNFTSWYDGSIYSIMVDRFNDGDKSNDIPVKHDSLSWQANYQGGDFQGIINKIEDGYFDTLGVNILWVSPVYDNPNVAYRESPKPYRWFSGYHGYWPINNFAVEEKFGTMKKLQELVTKAHQHNIKVLLDIVAHHVHLENPIFKEHPDWFGTLELPDGRKNLRLWDEHRLTTWFEPYMPSFDYTKSDVPIKWMAQNALWWLKESGADGFRHDAVKHVPNEFWRELTRTLKEEIETPLKKKVYQIGETFGSNELVGSYINNGQLSAQFDFNLSYSAIPIFLEKERSFLTLDYTLKKSFETFGVHHLMGNIMDSHDKVRFMAYADGDVAKQGIDMREMAWTNPPTVDHPLSYRKSELFYAFMFTIPGLPVIYYGSEFGMTGADDPDNRRFMRFDDQLNKYEKHMLNKTSNIVKMRRDYSALRYGDFQTILANDKVYAYLRCDANEKLLVILNKDPENQLVTVQLPSVYGTKSLADINSNEIIPMKGNSIEVKVDGTGWRVFELK